MLLARYELINDANKQKIINRFGNPYQFIIREPIRKLITKNNDILQQLLSYKYGDNRSLPIQRVKQYSRACDILDLITRIDDSRNRIIKDMNISVPEFYDHLKAIIEEEKRNGEKDDYEGYNQLYARFPWHYISLRDKVKEYKDKGFACIIDKAYGNDAALKVKTDDAQDFLLQLLKNPLQYNDVLITMLYNTKAQECGWKQITPATVQNWRHEYADEITPEREGVAAFNTKYIRQVKGLRPSIPLALVEHDDNNLDFLYQGADGSQYNRYVSIVVTDSHCDLVLGKSVIQGDTPETWQVHHAYLDAMYYIRSLTGAWYLPHEIKMDNWRRKSLDPFYQKVAKFAPPSHGNKHRGYIEQFFGSHLWKNCQKLVSDGNWNGNNMTAKFRGFNPDMLEVSLKEKSRPMIGDEAELQIERFFFLLRKMKDFKRSNMNAPSKEEQWLKAWNELPESQKNKLTDEQFLLTFGLTHTPKHTDSIRITNRGVEPQISNVKYSYDLPETWMYNKLQGESVKVIYDPFDMSRVLITNDKDIRFIAKEATLTPRALHDAITGTRTYLNKTLDHKREQVQQVATAGAKRKKVNMNQAEAMLQSGLVLPKEVKNAAEQKVLDKFNDKHEQYLDDTHDFNQFLTP